MSRTATVRVKGLHWIASIENHERRKMEVGEVGGLMFIHINNIIVIIITLTD